MAYSFSGKWPSWITPALKQNYEQFGNSGYASDQSSYDALINKMLGDQAAYDQTPAAAADPAYAQQAQTAAEAASRGLTVDQWAPIRQQTINSEGDQAFQNYTSHQKDSGNRFLGAMLAAAVGGGALAGGFGAAAAGGGGAATGGGLGAGTVVGPGGLPTAEAAIGAGQAAGTGAGIGDVATGATGASGGGVSHWLKLGNQLRGLVPHPQQQQPQMANLLQSSDPTRSALVQQLLARALRHG